MQQLIGRLSIKKTAVRMASVQFSTSSSKINWYLSNYTTNSAMNKAVSKLGYLNPKLANLENGVSLIKHEIFVNTSDVGDRPDIANVVLIFASSKNMPGLATTISRDKQLTDIATVVPVSIGQLNNKTLNQVTKQLPFLVTFNKYNVLAGEKNRSLDLVCNVITRAYHEAIYEEPPITTTGG